jgi:glucokinase
VSEARVAVGVDIGGTKVLGALIDDNGTILREHRLPSPDDWPTMRDSIVAVVDELRAQGPEIHALGVGAAGMVDLDGVIHYAPNVPGFRTVAVRAALAEATGLATVVDNDANTAAYAELRFGVARGLRDAMVITLGTGIGGGMIVNGGVLRGSNGFAAEIGHFQIDPAGPICACGEPGHWEAMASGNALGRMAREAAAAGEAPGLLERAGGEIDAIDGHLVSAAGHDGLPEALLLVDQYCFNVAIGLVGLANIFDPALIAISGGLVNDGVLFLDPIRRHFLGHIEGASYRPTPEIVPAALGERAGVIGAGILALDRAGWSPARAASG